MRVGIQGWGSEGDLRPLIALAARLHRAGHEVRLVLSLIDEMDYGPLCQRLGVPLQVVPERMQYSLRGICQASRSADPSKVSRELLDQAFFPHLEEMYAAAQALCAKSDVVIGLFSSWYVKAACLASGTPFVAVHYYPGLVPSREVPPIGFPSWRWLNRVSWALFGALIDLGFRASAARFFASKGLPPVRHALPDVLLSERLNLLATSPTLFPPAPDWGALHSVCGEFVLSDDDVPWQPSPSLRQFLESGEKPVLVSLGTMEHLAPERAKDLLLGAVRQAKVRAVIQTKSQGVEEGQDGEVYFLRWAPHRQLVPLCRAMVLHGGGRHHACSSAWRCSSGHCPLHL
ncbi:hypothetical protein ACN28E_18685 [Archangium lansingense]|uniref:hypothetical protein n=1 Tax=Archangium lansingense TaxID=2995310 RepID=UPI003B7AEF82